MHLIIFSNGILLLVNDMQFMIKKGILKILMNDNNESFDVEFFYNDHWIQLIFLVLMTNEQWDQSFINLKPKIDSFVILIINFFNELKIANNYHPSTKKSNYNEQKLINANFKKELVEIAGIDIKYHDQFAASSESFSNQNGFEFETFVTFYGLLRNDLMFFVREWHKPDVQQRLYDLQSVKQRFMFKFYYNLTYFN